MKLNYACIRLISRVRGRKAGTAMNGRANGIGYFQWLIVN
jgi:hypothetical protein